VVLRRLLPLAALALLPAPLAAQLPPLGMPGGTLRVEVHAAFGGATERIRGGTREDLGADFDSPALGADLLPVLEEPDARLASLTGIPGFRLSLGRSAGFASNTGGLGALGLSVGVTDQVTLFARVPFVTVTNRRRATFTDGEAGANAASPFVGDQAGQAAATGFFTAFDAALSTLEANIAAGAYAADPARDALARETLAGGLQFRDSLRAVVLDEATASPFLPLASSPGGAALSGRVTALQGTLSGELGVADFTGALPLPTAGAAYADVEALGLAPTGPYAYESYTGTRALGLGDAEVGAVVTLLDTWDRARLGGLRLAVEGLVRLPTGSGISADDAWPGATGDGQTDVEVNAVADVGRGSLGLRLQGGYQLQLGTTVTRRVDAPGALLVPVAQRGEVSLDPGDVLTLGVTPFVRLARPFAAYLTLAYRRRGADGVSWAGTAVPDVDVSQLARETDWSTVSWGFGVSYAEQGGRAGSQARVPIDAAWWWERVAAASGGRVAATSIMRLQGRYYFSLW
jgi:hypothetical protein